MIRRVLTGVLLAAVVLTAALPALAQDASASGTGTVTAYGSGRAELTGSGEVTISGSGTLIIISDEDDAIEVSGEGRRYVRGRYTIIRGFDGTAIISGRNLFVSLRGTDIRLEAAGTGTVKLWGRGSYSFNGQTGDWTPDGVTLSLE